VIYFQLFSVLLKQSAFSGQILLFLTEWPLLEQTVLYGFKRDDDIGNCGTIKLMDLRF
jgi:hypothetical protein